jgi:hypothetical protein
MTGVMALLSSARRVRVAWEPLVDLRTGALRGYRATPCRGEETASDAEVAAAMLDAAATSSRLPLGGRLLVVPVTAAAAGSREVAEILDATRGALPNVIVEIVDADGPDYRSAVRSLQRLGIRVALTDDVVAGLATWAAVEAARNAGANLGRGPALGAASVAFAPTSRAAGRRLRGLGTTATGARSGGATAAGTAVAVG